MKQKHPVFMALRRAGVFYSGQVVRISVDDEKKLLSEHALAVALAVNIIDFDTDADHPG
jgi:hypothetical protein